MALRKVESEHNNQENKSEGLEPNEAQKLLWKHYKHIQKLVKQKSRHYGLDPDDVLSLVLNEISKNNFGKIRAYEGRQQCTFKSFINTVVTHIVYSFLRKKKSQQKKFEKMEQDVFYQKKSIENSNQTIFDQAIKGPLELLVEIEDIEQKEKALAHLPEVLKNLDKVQQRTIKMRYYKDLKISTIAREFKLSRYKVKRILEDAKFKIKGQLIEILKRDNNPGS